MQGLCCFQAPEILSPCLQHGCDLGASPPAPSPAPGFAHWPHSFLKCALPESTLILLLIRPLCWLHGRQHRCVKRFALVFPCGPGRSFDAGANAHAPPNALHQTQHSSATRALLEHARGIAAGVLSTLRYFPSGFSVPGCLGAASDLLSCSQ